MTKINLHFFKVRNVPGFICTLDVIDKLLVPGGFELGEKGECAGNGARDAVGGEELPDKS